MGVEERMAEDEHNFDYVFNKMKARKNNGLGLLARVIHQTKPRPSPKAKVVDKGPVPPEQFLDDPYYLGGLQKLFPPLKVDFINVFAPGFKIVEVLETGAIGWGKSYFAGTALTYLLYLLSKLEDPHDHLGLAPGSEIVLINMSVTGANARNVVYKTVRFFVEHSPYFKKEFPLDKNIKGEIRLPNNIYFRPGNSSELSAIGQNIVGGAIDEVNFLPVTKQTSRIAVAMRNLDAELIEQSKILYTALQRRMVSRAMKGGKVFGKLFLMSSRLYEGDFTDQKMIEAQKDSTIYVMDYAEWETKPHKYSGKVFRVAIGDGATPSQIIPDRGAPPGKRRVVKVPVELRKVAEANLDSFLRDMAGVVVGAHNAFIKDREKIEQAIVKDLRCPFGQPLVIWRPDILDQVDWEMIKRQGDPEALRYCHFDLAKNRDCLGFGMAHVCGLKEVEVITGRDEEGSPIIDVVEMPVVQLDLVLRVKAAPGDEIPLDIPLELISRILSEGFEIGLTTFDQYQSVLPAQQLRKIGVETDILSLDTKPSTPYKVWRDALYTGRIKLYLFAPLTGKRKKEGRTMRWVSGELQKLLEDPRTGKVDHPAGGSKDLADGAVGAMFNALRFGDARGPSIYAGEPEDFSEVNEDEGWEIIYEEP